MESSEKHEVNSYFYILLEIVRKVWTLVMVMLLWPFILAIVVMFIITDDLAKACKYHKKCPWYSDQSETCTKKAGEYMTGFCESKLASCFERMENKYGNNSR